MLTIKVEDLPASVPPAGPDAAWRALCPIFNSSHEGRWRGISQIAMDDPVATEPRRYRDGDNRLLRLAGFTKRNCHYRRPFGELALPAVYFVLRHLYSIQAEPRIYYGRPRHSPCHVRCGSSGLISNRGFAESEISDWQRYLILRALMRGGPSLLFLLPGCFDYRCEGVELNACTWNINGHVITPFSVERSRRAPERLMVRVRAAGYELEQVLTCQKENEAWDRCLAAYAKKLLRLRGA